MGLGERIKQVRLAMGMSQKDFAKLIGITQGPLSLIEREETVPSGETLIAICEKCNISADWLLTGDRNRVDVSKDKQAFYDNLLSLPTDMQTWLIDYFVKLYNKENMKKEIDLKGETAAGEPIDFPDDYAMDELVPVPESAVADFALRIKGDSMEPDFPDGSIIYVKQQETVESGQLAVVALDGMVTFKKIRWLENGKGMDLVSINPMYAPIRLKNPGPKLRIIGIVKHPQIKKPGKGPGS